MERLSKYQKQCAAKHMTRYRDENNLSQTELAEMAGVPQWIVSAAERRDAFTPESAQKIADAMKITLTDLLSDARKNGRPKSNGTDTRRRVMAALKSAESAAAEGRDFELAYRLNKLVGEL